MLMNVTQLCKQLGISRQTAFVLIKDGMPVVRLSERIIRFEWDDVQKWYKQKAV
jgi:excisionase family DNA binding protein